MAAHLGMKKTETNDVAVEIDPNKLGTALIRRIIDSDNFSIAPSGEPNGITNGRNTAKNNLLILPDIYIFNGVLHNTYTKASNTQRGARGN